MKQVTKSELRFNRQAKIGKKGRVYFSGDLDDMTPKELMKSTLLLEALLKAGVEKIEAEKLVESAKFSQRAGCACGCSPGIILKGLHSREIFVDVVTK
jgi:hypothetical protein